MSEVEQVEELPHALTPAKEFASVFEVPLDHLGPLIPWTDGVGFSRLEKFSNGHASLYKFGISNQELRSSSLRKKIWGSVSYGEESDSGIKLGNSKISDPIDLSFFDEFYYDTLTRELYHYDQKISARELLTLARTKHLRPTRKFLGLGLRARLFWWRKILPFLTKISDFFLIGILWLISGETVKENLWIRLFGTYSEKSYESIQPKTPEFGESKTMDFFGYKAKRWSVVFYCSLHLGLYILITSFWPQLYFKILSVVFNNNFLSLTYIVVSFAITEAGLPGGLKWLIRKVTPKALGIIANKTLRV